MDWHQVVPAHRLFMYMMCWHLDLWVGNCGSSCITKFTTCLSLSWRQRIVWLTVVVIDCDSEVIRSYKGSAQTFFSLLPLLSYLGAPYHHSSPPLPRTPSYWAAADHLKQPVNKSSCCSAQQQCNSLKNNWQDTASSTGHQPQGLQMNHEPFSYLVLSCKQQEPFS